MNLTSWIILLGYLTYVLEACTKTPGCDKAPPSNLKILSPPNGPRTYSPPGPISLKCTASASGDSLDTIRWIRNNSDGNSTILESSSPVTRLFPLFLWNAELTDSPSERKFPYTYQCVAFGKCCEEIRSPPKVVNFLPVTTAPTTVPTTAGVPGKILTIHDIRPTVSRYSGYGKIQVKCAGGGDTSSMVHWIRTNKDGNNITLNSTELTFNTQNNLTVWQAVLNDRPADLSQFPYKYQCVLENKCCPTKKLSVDVSYTPLPFCPFFSIKPIKWDEIANKRSVKITWIYDVDPEDTGFSIEITNRKTKSVVLPKTKINITSREYVAHGLDPYEYYRYRLQILYGKECTTFHSFKDFMTLADIPSAPRNVTIIVKENTLNVSWQLPKFPNGAISQYILSWKRTHDNEKYKQKNVTAHSFIVKDLDGFTSYSVRVQAMNQAGIGNFSEPVFAATRKDPRKKIQIQEIKSETKPYTGFGKVQVLCVGDGDNASRIYWIRTDKDGKNITLNTTSVEQGNDGIWRAELLDRPDINKFPYSYKCAMENRCCLTEISSTLAIPYSTPKSNCPNVESIKKPIKVDVIPDKRSVEFTWTYDADPEDTGFRFQVDSRPPAKILNISKRTYTVRYLDANKKYNYSYTILYGRGCQVLVSDRYFTTFPDYPSKPENITVIAEGNALNVSWLPPKYPNGQMKHYVLSWARSAEENRYTKKNVTSSPYLIENLDYFTPYSIKLQAVNTLGIGESSDPVTATTQKQKFPTQKRTTDRRPTDGRTTDGMSTDGKPVDGGLADESSNSGAIAGGVVGAILFLILVLILLLFLRRRFQRKQHNRSVREFHKRYLTPLDNQDNVDIKTPEEPMQDLNAESLPEKTDIPDEISYIVLLEDWEIAPDNLKLLDKKLGGGQFGIVKQGLFASGKGDPEIVAVKTVKDGSSESDLSDLMTELKILKEVNKVPHPNVIRLIGGCSIGGKLHVVTEFCPGGNLRILLINSRVYPSAENSSNYINLASTLNHRQLLKIAADICSGMVHLGSQKFVHRDLAARNILIGEDNMAKVSDFGLARDVSGAEEYIRNNQNLLPVKWMALESLLHGRFTTASDVWSYGVLLHEIATLGEEPYKNISPYNIVSHVGSGCRMPQPPQCSDEVYEIMKNCWKVEPTERPSFEDMHKSLQDMLVDNEKSYINLAHVVDEGPLAVTTTPTNISIKGGTIRYTAA